MLANIEEKRFTWLQDNISTEINRFKGKSSLYNSEPIIFIRNLHFGGAQYIFPTS